MIEKRTLVLTFFNDKRIKEEGRKEGREGCKKEGRGGREGNEREWKEVM